VVGISGTGAVSAGVAKGLAGAGYRVTATASPAPATTTESVIRYPPGSVGPALGLLRHLSGAVILVPDPGVAAGSLTLEAGSVVALAGPVAATPTGRSGPGTTAATAATAASAATSIPTALQQTPSSSADHAEPFDPSACPETP
jgi:hypothetical protein